MGMMVVGLVLVAGLAELTKNPVLKNGKESQRSNRPLRLFLNAQLAALLDMPQT